MTAEHAYNTAGQAAGKAEEYGRKLKRRRNRRLQDLKIQQVRELFELYGGYDAIVKKGIYHESAELAADHWKYCLSCGHEFKDITRPKNKKTCGKKCAYEWQKVRQQIDYKAKPRKVIAIHDKEVSYSPDRLEGLWARIEANEVMGGRKKGKPFILYDGDEKGHQKKVALRFAGDDDRREASGVVTIKKTAEEIEADLAARYGDKR